MTSLHAFDLAVIGSGPAAVAALDGLAGRGLRIAVITGATPSAAKLSSLHPKIQSESLKERAPPGVAELLHVAGAPSKDLFSTAATGGLANYWGQQVVRLDKGDAWPSEVFDSYQDYEDACAHIESLFEIVGGNTVDNPALEPSYASCRPRLLVGTSSDKAAGLRSMKQAFHDRSRAAGAEIFDGRVETIGDGADRLALQLADGRGIAAERVMLAAGAIGDANLIARSWSEVEAVLVSDHAPWMVYTVGTRLRFPSGGIGSHSHFNALNVAKAEAGQNAVFASAYDMSKADINLMLASTLGRALPFLRGWPAPPGSSLLRPVQIWTSKTVDVIRIDVLAGLAEPHTIGVPAPAADVELLALIGRLKGASIMASQPTPTPPGRGFHYHNLVIDTGRTGLLAVRDFLGQRMGGRVVCVDGGALTSISCQPPTLTMMAQARRLAERHSA